MTKSARSELDNPRVLGPVGGSIGQEWVDFKCFNVQFFLCPWTLILTLGKLEF